MFSGTTLGIGHTRYSTAGRKDATNCIQPFVVHTVKGLLAVAHNGELVNADGLRRQVLSRGVGLSTDTDSELIAQLLASAPSIKSNVATSNSEFCWGDAIENMMEQLTLSYSLAVLTADTLYAVRDPFGNRPLCVGELKPSHCT